MSNQDLDKLRESSAEVVSIRPMNFYFSVPLSGSPIAVVADRHDDDDDAEVGSGGGGGYWNIQLSPSSISSVPFGPGHISVWEHTDSPGRYVRSFEGQQSKILFNVSPCDLG